SNAIVAPYELQIPFTVQDLNPIRDSDGDPPPPKGPFFIAGEKPLRYPIDGVLSLVVSDKTPGSKFSGGAIFNTLSNVYKVAIASPVKPKPREVTFEAIIDPPDKTPPDGFPEWTMAGLTYKGKKVTIPFEAYKGTRPPAGNFWRASAFTPDSYDLTCDPSGSPQSIRIQVYPSEARVLEVGIKDFVGKFDELLNVFSNLSGNALFPFNDGFQIKAFQAASDDVARIHKGILAMDAARQGLVPFDEEALDGKPLKKSRKSAGPADLKFSFANAWEECNDPRTGRSNEVNLTYRAKAAFDPLISAQGKISIKYPVPSFPFIIVDVGFGLAGKLGLSVDIFRNGCAQEISTCGKLTGNLTATVSVGVSVIYMVGVEAATQTGLTTDATICADFNTKKIEATFKAQFDGIKTTVSLTFIGGVLKRTSDPIVLCDPYPFTPSVFTLYTFQ
ncbi:MAG TPA: hypothetical protein VK995_02720, partial [Oceanipulchritudo sp.]|nr:hypothetical protein [Oceanipulchritudo sp.]